MAKKDVKKVKKAVKKVTPKVVKPVRGVYTKRGKQYAWDGHICCSWWEMAEWY